MPAKAFPLSEIVTAYTGLILPESETSQVRTTALDSHLLGAHYEESMEFNLLLSGMESLANGGAPTGIASVEGLKEKMKDSPASGAEAQIETLFPGAAAQAFSKTKPLSAQAAEKACESIRHQIAAGLEKQLPWLKDISPPLFKEGRDGSREEACKVFLAWMNDLTEKHGPVHTLIPISEIPAQPAPARGLQN